MATVDRLERLTDLVLVLVDAARPLTLDEISREVPGYPHEHSARRQAFERDKRLLRDEGVPVLTERVGGEEQYGYRIDPATFYLADLDLDPDEAAALYLAVAGVELGDTSGREALWKLGSTNLPDTPPMAALTPPAVLVPLYAAVRDQALVTFTYRGTTRSLAPGGLWFRGGRWYLVGWDHRRDAARTFRVDRIEGTPTSGVAGSATLPDGFDPAASAPGEPWRVGPEDDDDVRLLVDAVAAGRVVHELGEAAVLEHRDDGSVLVRLGATNVPALRSWVLSLLDHAEVVGPPSMRTAVVSWLESIATTAGLDGPTAVEGGARRPRPSGPHPSPDSGRDAQRGQDHGREGVTAAPLPPSPRTVKLRLRRLLAIVGWLAREPEATLAEVAHRFGLSEPEVVHELELAACCGRPPYSPDTLLEIVVTDTAVQAHLSAELARPRRLTPAEGFALAAAARTVLAVPGADPAGALARAVDKLDRVLGSHLGLEVHLDSPRYLDSVRDAADRGRCLDIEYHSVSTDELTSRRIEPLRVVSLDGHWYVDAYCHRTGGLRRFRVDRIGSARAAGQRTYDGELPSDGQTAFVPSEETAMARLSLGPDAEWVADAVPVLDSVRRAGGGLEVTVAVGGTAWLERLLLQAGPDARVLDPPDLADTGRRAAARVLARYATARPAS